MAEFVDRDDGEGVKFILRPWERKKDGAFAVGKFFPLNEGLPTV
jgi:hypothetical protein